MVQTFTASVLVTLALSASAKYTLKDDYSGDNFFSNFEFFSEADPTKGFVQYQNRENAFKQNLAGFLDGSVALGVDYKQKTPQGRPSVRVSSKKSYNHGLLVADIKHMPDSTPGLWPAFWLVGKGSWPDAGEIDILEGVNDYQDNTVTLHTSMGCVVDNSSSDSQSQTDAKLAFSGTLSKNDCNVVGTSDNVGCSIHASNNHAQSSYTVNTYGTNFNKNSGGVYAMEWTSQYISVWFFPRNTLPEHKDLLTTPDPTTFGTPLAHFAGSGCDFNRKFRDLQIVFDTTFCGEWAGQEWTSKGLAQKTGVAQCVDFVQDNPQAFTEAYWEIAGLKWFEENGQQQQPNVPSANATHVGRYSNRRQYGYQS